MLKPNGGIPGLCPHCKGTGRVVVKSATGEREARPCPACRGSGKGSGLVTK